MKKIDTGFATITLQYFGETIQMLVQRSKPIPTSMIVSLSPDEAHQLVDALLSELAEGT